MCTVTFIPSGNKVFITSSRDEKTSRKLATPPRIYTGKKGRLLYPTDGDKKGSWIVCNQNGDTGVLLNGALTAHVSKTKYRQSRGTILPAMMQHKDPLKYFLQTDFTGIEPFTCILYARKQLHECRWDEQSKTVVALSVSDSYIWSSATLYEDAVAERRRQWFNKWKEKEGFATQDSINRFHRLGGAGDEENSILMNRNNVVRTVSITSVEISKRAVVMSYADLADGKNYCTRLTNLQQMKLDALTAYTKRFWIRLTHWEFWPFFIVYIPVYFYWFWLCLKARSFFFFNAANPAIRNGGFLMESKKQIYDLLPPGTYPDTMSVERGIGMTEVRKQLEQENILFPVIAKPDIGLRGMGVALLADENELAAYHRHSKVDYLLQNYISYPNEAGIFYYRKPGEKKGRITGITGKRFLTVEGDGVSTVADLLGRESRYYLQIPALLRQEPMQLSEVIRAGEKRLLVPFGNHCRGAEFLDLTEQLTDQLTATINEICYNTKGFYFGRLDLKYNSWKELCEGKAFSIIELNGAGSEPAHIYDPKHSIFFAWKEIIRHLAYLYEVSIRNRQLKKVPYLTVKQGFQMFRDNAEHVGKIA